MLMLLGDRALAERCWYDRWHERAIAWRMPASQQQCGADINIHNGYRHVCRRLQR